MPGQDDMNSMVKYCMRDSEVAVEVWLSSAEQIYVCTFGEAGAEGAVDVR